MINFKLTHTQDGISGICQTTTDNLQSTTNEIYNSIFDIIQQHNFYLYKCYNYVPDIIGHDGDQQRYHQFNRGRREAWDNSGYKHRPAACALGATDNQLTIRFVAGPTLPIEIENSRQISAYNYPPQYGYPLFARAVSVDKKLYVSGTASVVGHETTNIGSIKGQFDETMTNLKIILGDKDFKDFNFTVYVKQLHDLATVKQLFNYDATFILCDICRPELLLEIEADPQND